MLGKIQAVPHISDKGNHELRVDVFAQQEGIKNFKLYEKKSAALKKVLGDEKINTEAEQLATLAAVRAEMHDHEDKGRLVLPTELGGALAVAKPKKGLKITFSEFQQRLRKERWSARRLSCC